MADQRRRKRRKKKKSSPLGKVLLVLLILLLLAAGTAAGIAIHSLNKIRRVDTQQEVWIDPVYEDFEADDPAEPAETSEGSAPEEEAQGDTISPESIDWNKPDPVEQNDHVHNILLIGQDRRPGEGRARSDTMIICSVNEETGEIRLCSLMRDMYVPFPGGYSDNKINAAYTFGGMSLLDALIEQDFGIPIEGNVEVDFDGFIQVMDLIAPLQIELTDVEAWYLNNGTGWQLRTGLNAMTGEQLLRYARVRSIGHADYDRTARQRKVLAAAFDKIRTLSVARLTALADAALPCITTDMTNADIMRYVYMVGSNRMTIGATARIPADNAHTSGMIRGMSVLVPDLAENSRILKEFLYS